MLEEYIKDLVGYENVEVKLIDEKYVITQTLDCKLSQPIHDFYKRTNYIFVKMMCKKLEHYLPREMYIIETKTINEPICLVDLNMK